MDKILGSHYSQWVDLLSASQAIIESFEVIELIDLTEALNLGKPSWTNSHYL